MKLIIAFVCLLALTHTVQAIEGCDGKDTVNTNVMKVSSTNIKLHWNAPERYCNGTPIGDDGGSVFYLYAGETTNTLVKVGTNDWSNLQFDFSIPTMSNVYYFGVSAVDIEGTNESGRAVRGARFVSKAPTNVIFLTK